MTTIRRSVCLPVAIVIGLALGRSASQTDAGEPKDALLGGKMLQRLPYEVYREPIFFDTSKGPRLAVWLHEGVPSQRIAPGDLNPKVVKQPTATPFELCIWDVEGGKQFYRLKLMDKPPAYPDTFSAVEYTPSAKNLLTVEAVSFGIRLKLYDLVNRKERILPALPVRAALDIPRVVCAPNGDLVIVLKTQCIVYDLNKAKTRRVFPWQVPAQPNRLTSVTGQLGSPAVTPDGKTLACFNVPAGLEVYDLEKGKPLWQLPPPQAQVVFNPVSLAFLPMSGATKLLAVHSAIPDADRGKYVMLAQYLDIKNKSEISRAVLLEGGEFKPGASSAHKPQVDRSPGWDRAVYPFFNNDGAPRVIADGKLFDATTGKVLRQTKVAYRYILSRDGKYAVRVTGTQGSDTAKMGLELWSVDRSQ